MQKSQCTGKNTKEIISPPSYNKIYYVYNQNKIFNYVENKIKQNKN